MLTTKQLVFLLPLCCCCAGLTRDNWSYIAYALTAVTVIIFLFTIAMLRRIQVAVACIKVRPSWQLWSTILAVLVPAGCEQQHPDMGGTELPARVTSVWSAHATHACS